MWAECSPQGEEKKEEVFLRVYKALDEIKSKFGDKNILIVTHGYVTKVIYKYFTNCTDEEFTLYRQDNCEIKEYNN